MVSIILLVASVATFTFAAPTPADQSLNDAYRYSDHLAEFYSRVSRHIDHPTGRTKCETDKITLPSSSLEAPTGKVQYVGLGRGTQVNAHLLEV